MKKNTNSIIYIALLLLLNSCSKNYYDINKNPNAPTEETITPALILPNALHYAGVQTAVRYGWLNNWMGYWSVSAAFAPDIEERTYNITSNFGEPNWNGIYNVLFDLYNTEKKSGPNDQFYRAAALVLKAHLFQNLVDMFGNVPYSQAFQSKEFPTPKYDKAEDIYADLQASLDTAVNIFEHVEIGDAEATNDIVYGGDLELWRKFANTIKLRLLLRQSEVVSLPTAELAKITDHGGILESEETAAANPGYAEVQDKQNPYYDAFGTLANGNEANNFYRANNHLITILRANSDPRIGYFYAEALSPTNPNNVYVGTVYGGNSVPGASGDNYSNIGPGLAKSADQPQWILTSVEALFLKAEAIARGWLPGNVKTAYEEAVAESFLWLNVEDAAQETTNYLKLPTADWSKAGTTVDSQVKFILYQKYIAMAGLNPLEAWCDYRRMGVPADPGISADPARISNVLPSRLLYPTTEYAANPENVKAQGTINQFTSKIFWDK